MRHIITGAGAVGGSVGGCLALAGHEVVLVARGAHLDALRAGGLRLGTPSGWPAVAALGLPVVCALNGVANERFALRRFRHVYGMCVWLPATHVAPGAVAAQYRKLLGNLGNAFEALCGHAAARPDGEPEATGGSPGRPA